MSIDIRIVGSANLGQVKTELGKVALSAEAANKAFRDQSNAIQSSGSRQKVIRHYQEWSVAQNALRDSTIAHTRAVGAFDTMSIKAGSATDGMVERMQKGTLTFRQARNEMGLLKKTFEDQIKIQQSYARTWGQTAAGNTHVDMYTPNFKVQGQGWDFLKQKVGFYNEALKSVSQNTINWGKNTQWSGRQLMAGITYPLILAGGLMAKTAYDVDKGLTQIVKVYGDAGDSVKETDEQIKTAALSTAKSLTQYGQSVNDTLEIQSQLASTGKTGPELQAATAAVTKARLLGELNIQDAMQATINMQEVYGFGADKLAEKFNFMNQMENETSLTMQDFVEGIPKISGIMNTLGADFEDTGILLAAMKTAGIDAKEGGNAIKSMVFKDVAPSAKAIKVFADTTGQSIEAIVESTKGDPIATLQGIGRAIENLPPTDQIAVIKEVFGIHQGSKAIGMIKALSGETEQMGKAFKIASAGADEWNATAEGELKALKESDWVKVQKAIQDTKIGMVEFGKVFLHALTPALQKFGDIMNSVSDWMAGASKTKKMIVAWGVAILAATGPIIMLVGLFANLAGNAGRATAAIIGLVKSEPLMTRKQKAAALAANTQTDAVNNLTKALQKQLYVERELIRETMMKKGNVNKAYGISVASPGPGLKRSMDNPSAVNAAAASSMVGGYATMNVKAPTESERSAWSNTVKDSGKIAENTAKTSGLWGKIAGNAGRLAVGASMLAMMTTESGSIANKMANIVFLASLVGPTLLAGLKRAGVISYLAKTGAAVKSSALVGAIAGKAAAARTGIMALGSSIAAMAGPIGIATVAIGGLFYMYRKKIEQARKEQEALNNSVDTFAEVAGVELRDPLKLPEGAKKSATDYIELAKRAKEANEDLAKSLEKLPEAERTPEAALQYGIARGNEARVRGATAEAAAEIARITAVAVNKTLATDIQLKIRATAFVNVEDVKVNEIDRVRRQILDEVKDATNFESVDAGSEVWIGGQSSARSYMINTANLESDIKASYQILIDAEGKERQKAFQKISTDVYAGMQQLYNDTLSDAQRDAMKKKGIFDGKQMAEWMGENGGLDGLSKYMADSGVKLEESQKAALSQNEAVLKQAIIFYLMNINEWTREKASNYLAGRNSIDVLAEFNLKVDPSQESDAALFGAMQRYEEKVKSYKFWGINLTKDQELFMLNEDRVAAGLQKTTNIRDGMNRKITSTIDAVKKENADLGPNAAGWERAATAVDKATKAKKEYNIMSNSIDDRGQSDPSVRFDSSTEEGKAKAAEMAGKFTESYKSAMAAAQEEMFAMAADELENAHQSAIDAIDRDEKQMSARLDALQESREAEFEKRSEAIDRDFERKERQFEARWEKAMENFDTRWDKTLENFDTKWENKNEKFSAKWDATMERFDKSAEKAKKAVEDQYDSRIKKVEEAIKAEQEAEDVRQRIFEKEKSRIQHLADMANRSIDISMSINSGDLDEAAKLSNDAQAAIETYDMDDAGESSQSASDKRIESLEKKKESISKKKDLALQRIDERMKAERDALEEQRKIAEKAFKVSQEKERKILEGQRTAARKSLESQKDKEKRELEARKASLKKRLEADRADLAQQIKDQHDANVIVIARKRRLEDNKYKAAKNALDKETTALRGAIPRNEEELLKHMKQIEKSYDAYGGALKKKGDGWGKDISTSTTKHMSNARVAMQNEINWEKMGKTIASRMTKGTFNMTLGQFQKWVSGGAKPETLAKLIKKKTKRGSQSNSGGRGLAGNGTVGYRHTGGIIDGGKGSRRGFSGKGNSQSEIDITALRGEAVLNRKATRALGSDGVNALNRGALPQSDAPRHKGSDHKSQRGDGPGIAGIASMFSSGTMTSVTNALIHQLGAGQIAKDQAAEMGMLGNWTASGLEVGRFGGVGLGAEQLKNASTIASVGRSLGASSRDIIIALMTAMQESTLRNISYGDRDSVGLFQQRAPWGSFADRTNPRESARMFFQGGKGGQPGLFSKGGRNAMSLAQAAQAVQVSAYPDAYAKWEDMARALSGAIKWKGSNASIPGSVKGGAYPGMGWRKQFSLVSKAFPNRGFPEANQTTGGGHAKGSYHYQGRAVDLGSAKDSVPLSTLFNWIYKNYGSQSAELIYGPMAHKNIKDGRHLNYGSATNNAHMSHVHWAMKTGGIVPGMGSGDKTHIMGEPGEFMLRKKAVDKVGPEYLKMLNSDRFINMPSGPVASVKNASPAGNIDNSVVNKYDISIDASGNAQPADVKDAVVKALTEIERRKGFNRRIGN